MMLRLAVLGDEVLTATVGGTASEAEKMFRLYGANLRHTLRDLGVEAQTRPVAPPWRSGEIKT